MDDVGIFQVGEGLPQADAEPCQNGCGERGAISIADFSVCVYDTAVGAHCHNIRFYSFIRSETDRTEETSLFSFGDGADGQYVFSIGRKGYLGPMPSTFISGACEQQYTFGCSQGCRFGNHRMVPVQVGVRISLFVVIGKVS